MLTVHNYSRWNVGLFPLTFLMRIFYLWNKSLRSNHFGSQFIWIAAGQDRLTSCFHVVVSLAAWWNWCLPKLALIGLSLKTRCHVISAKLFHFVFTKSDSQFEDHSFELLGSDQQSSILNLQLLEQVRRDTILLLFRPFETASIPQTRLTAC